MISLSSAVSLCLWLGPWLIPRAIAFFRSIKASNRPGQVIPTPPRVKLALNILFAFVIVTLVQTIPQLSPPNIFRETSSRLAISSNLLWNRVNNARNGQLTPLDQALKARYSDSGRDFPLLYAAYGPNTLADCLWCNTESPDTYLYYSIPSLLVPHIFHAFIILSITSTFFVGLEASRWRLYGIMAAASLALVEVIMLFRNDWRINTTKRTLGEVDFFFWRMRITRLAAFAVLDSLLGWALWLTSTKRWLVQAPPMSQQVIIAANTLKLSALKLSLLSRMHAAVVADDTLYAAGVQEWSQEPKRLAELEMEREVVDAKRLALSRMDIDKVRREAQGWVGQVWSLFRPGHIVQQGGHSKTE